MKNFWQKLPRPFTVLAPLDGVTDFVFRQMITTLGKPDVLFTEFTPCDGLQSEGRKIVEKNLLFNPNEQPIVAQVWGAIPENFYKTAQEIKELGFSGIDINMGCPDKTVIKDGACSNLINNHPLTAEIIKATQEGSGGLPVSVKTRIGFHTQEIDKWIGFLLTHNLSAVSIHLRTVEELSRVPAHWEYMPRIIELRNTYAPDTIVIGNGDIINREEIPEKFKKYGCEGFMIGRGIFANPWLFNQTQGMEDVSVTERFETFLQHIVLFEKTWGTSRNFANLKKFCKTYINNFPDAARCRDSIMEAKSLQELIEVVTKFKNSLILS